MSEPAAPPGALAIDAHAHVFDRALPQVADRRYAPAVDAPLAVYLQHLDRAGLTHGVLVQPSFLGTDNRHMLAAIASVPGRLRGIAVVEPSITVQALEALERGGVVGVRLNVLDRPIPVCAGADWSRLLDFVAAHRWHVEVHGRSNEVETVLGRLDRTPVRIVVDHFGRPGAASGGGDAAFDALLARADTGRVWVKLSGAYRFERAEGGLAEAAAHDLLSAFGPTRLVWGSDWPHTTFEQRVSFDDAVDGLRGWVAEPEARRRILGATAAELFHVPDRIDTQPQETQA